MTKDQSKFLDTLVKKHQTTMVQLTYRRTGQWQLAKDLVQETFLLACYKIHILYEHDNPAAWLYNSLHKLTLRELGKSYHHTEVPLSEELATSEEILDLSIENYFPNKLNAKERELLLWRVEEKCSFREIADRRGISEEACRKQFSRLIQKCRKLLKKEAEIF